MMNPTATSSLNYRPDIKMGQSLQEGRGVCDRVSVSAELYLNDKATGMIVWLFTEVTVWVTADSSVQKRNKAQGSQ